MNLEHKKIGIWGYGVVGKSALNFLLHRGIKPEVMDCKTVTPEEQQFFEQNKISYIPQKHHDDFFNNNDLIITSPGIDLRPFKKYHEKFINELDLFYTYFNKPIIAITGTIGKTSITHLLSNILMRHKKIVTGGNIGTGMLDLITNNQAEGALLELSSFQLEQCQSFAPDLAIWTNLYPNHLDRHETFQNYFEAKYSIIRWQHEHQQALIPYELTPLILKKNNRKNILHFFSIEPLTTVPIIPEKSSLYWIEDGMIYRWYQGLKHPLVSTDRIPPTTFIMNGLIITAALSLLNLPLSLLDELQDQEIPAHRIEKCGSLNLIEFYNDSKSTIMESTIAAVEKLSGRPIILILGGLSKGVDRSPYFQKLHHTVKHIVSFGAEAEQLAHKAQKYGIKTTYCPTLDEALNTALTIAQPFDQILLSPGGSSYDLYHDYQERGTHFKQLVTDYSKSQR